MKTYLQRLIAALLIGATAVSCTTAYDAYGNPRQVVEPGTAALAAVGAGLAGYAIANNRNRSSHHHNRGYGYGYNNYGYSGYNRSYARSPYRHANYSRGRTFQGYRQIRY
ncbi:MAG: hypothetical protein V4662_05355 [Verrucomicrobiota bacterium]